MPQAVTYEVQAPDGTPIKFMAAPGMTDDQIIMRAQQEYAFKTGKIPTTKAAAYSQSAGETIADQSKLIGAGIGLTGTLTAQPEVVAAAPLVGRALKAGGEYLAGRPITPTSAGEVATLGAEGAIAGYGPQIVSKGLDSIAAKTAPHINPLTGKYVVGAKGTGFWPWAIRTGGEYADAASNALHKSSQAIAAIPSALQISESTDALSSDIKTMTDAIQAGMNPPQAAARISQGNTQRFGQLMSAYIQSKSVQPLPDNTKPLNSPPEVSDVLRMVLGPNWRNLAQQNVLGVQPMAEIAKNMLATGATPSEVRRRLFGADDVDYKLPKGK